MMPTINIDQAEFDTIDLAANITNMSHAQVIARLVHQSRLPSATTPAPSTTSNSSAIYADYAGYRTTGSYDRMTKRIDITDGPLAGQSFKSPSSAARAVVSHYKPNVSPHRNGWSFWMVDDGSGRFLQSLR